MNSDEIIVVILTSTCTANDICVKSTVQTDEEDVATTEVTLVVGEFNSGA